MPLPPALAARLEKRGLIAGGAPNQAQKRDRGLEEVIAEDDGDRKKRALLAVKAADSAEKPSVMGHPGCPNKYNVHHECSVFCSVFWGNGILEPDKVYLRRKKRMLAKYPLPDTWKEEYDPGCGRFFYWEPLKNIVSWLPPLHPRFQPSEAASILRERTRLQQLHTPGAAGPTISVQQGESAAATDSLGEDSGSDDSDSDSDSDESEGGEELHVTERVARPVVRGPPRKPGRGPPNKRNDLDPMDPASYSDIPRGTWATGLDKCDDEAKTGVDTTASGPLFQQRPYPSPGAILRANAATKKK